MLKFFNFHFKNIKYSNFFNIFFWVYSATILLLNFYVTLNYIFSDWVHILYTLRTFMSYLVLMDKSWYFNILFSIHYILYYFSKIFFFLFKFFYLFIFFKINYMWGFYLLFFILFFKIINDTQVKVYLINTYYSILNKK